MKLTAGTIHGEKVDGWFFGPWTDLHENPIVREKIDLTAPVDVRAGPDLAFARGRMVGKFLEGDGDALLMLDSDMWFTVATIIEMWDVYQQMVAQDPKACILGGLAFILGGPRVDPRHMQPTMWLDDPERGAPFMAQVLAYPRDQMARVNGTGGACLMVGRQCLEELQPNPFAIYGLPDGDRLGEDLSFCRRAGDAGYSIFVHTALKFEHAKTVLVGEEDYLPILNQYQSPGGTSE